MQIPPSLVSPIVAPCPRGHRILPADLARFMMLALLAVTTTLPAQDVKLAPLMSAQKIKDKEVFAEQRYCQFDDKTGHVVFIVDNLIEKGLLAGETVYLHETWREEVLAKEGRLGVRHSYALYDQDFRLIEAHAIGWSKGRYTELRYRWQDDKLLLLRPKRKPLTIETATRPKDPLGVMMSAKIGPDKAQVLSVLDFRRARCDQVEIKRIGTTWTIKDPRTRSKTRAWQYQLERDGGTRLYLDCESGELIKGSIRTETKAKRISSTDLDLETCSLSASLNPAALTTTHQRLFDGWTKRGRKRTHKELGIQLKIPDGWTGGRYFKVDSSTIFLLKPEAGGAMMQILHFYAPARMDPAKMAKEILEDWKVDFDARSTTPVHETTLGGMPAYEASYRETEDSRDNDIVFTMVRRRGWTLIVMQDTHRTAKASTKAEMDKLIQSIRFSKE